MSSISILLSLFLVLTNYVVIGRRLLPVKMMESAQQPVLRFREPTTKCNIHLVGVSHGSPASASLVEEVMQKVRPSVVVLELCDDRYLSISLDNKIRPKFNATFQALYDKRLKSIERMETSPTQSAVNSFLAYLKFFRAQGPLIGSFISIGMFVSALQKLFKSFPKGDEFTTAMRIANDMNIPVRVCDAPQQQTLKSLQNLIDWDILRPAAVVDATKMLLFSAFGVKRGVFPWSGNTLDTTASLSNNWINIPAVYANDRTMLKSLTPIGVIFAWSILLGLLPSNGEAMELLPPLVSSQDVTEMTSIVQNIVGIDFTPKEALNAVGDVTVSTLNSGWEWLQIAASSSLPPEVDQAINTAITMTSFLLLVRMAKIIGADRDRIISKKIKQICDDYPRSDIVVVVGMLHCNGVASWLLSGQDPDRTSRF